MFLNLVLVTFPIDSVVIFSIYNHKHTWYLYMMCCKSFSLCQCISNGEAKISIYLLGKPVVYVGVVFGDQKVKFELGNRS